MLNESNLVFVDVEGMATLRRAAESDRQADVEMCTELANLRVLYNEIAPERIGALVAVFDLT